jgi:hypothetical protein
MRLNYPMVFAVSISLFATGASTAVGQDKHKKEKEEAARHAAEKAEHERKKHEEEAARKAAHARKIHEEEIKKAEHEKKHHHEAHNPEHQKKMKEESEARIAAAKKHRETHPVDKKKQTEQDRKIAETLSNVAVGLHKADHDYDWQRHEAVELVRGALHALHEPEPNTSGKFGGMTQKQSDQILRENIPVLEKAKAELSAKGSPAHHQAAKQKVEEALSNLNAALKIN